MPLRSKPRTQVRLNPLSCGFMLRFFGGKEMKKKLNRNTRKGQASCLRQFITERRVSQRYYCHAERSRSIFCHADQRGGISKISPLRYAAVEMTFSTNYKTSCTSW